MEPNDISKKKNILILTCEAGAGHQSAAKALRNALLESYGEACTISLANPFDDSTIPTIVRDLQFDYDHTVNSLPRLYELGYKVTDGQLRGIMLENGLTVMFYLAVRNLYRQYKPDVIVNTFPFYQPSIEAFFLLGGYNTPVITIITDYKSLHHTWFHPIVDYCVVPSEEARHLAIKAGLPAERVKIIGIPANPEFSRRVERKAIREKIGWDAKKITVFISGSKRSEKIWEYIPPLNHSGFDLQFAITAGGSKTLMEKFETMEWHHPVHLYSYVDNMPDMLRASDIIICKPGGLMVTESLASGLPMLLVDAIPGQETGNVEYVVQRNAGDYVESPLGMLEALSHLLINDGRLLEERTRAARETGRPNAALEIADLVWEMAQINPVSRPTRFAERLSKTRVLDLLTSFNIRADE